MTPHFWDSFARYAVWLVVLLLLAKCTMSVLVEPEGGTLSGTSFPSALAATQEIRMRGTVVVSPSSSAFHTSGITYKRLAGSSTVTDSSTCTIRVEKYADGCSDLVTDCKGLQYWELYTCERH